MAATIAQVQKTTASFVFSPAVLTIAVTITPTAGSTLAVFVTWDSNPLGTVSVADTVNGSHSVGPLKDDATNQQAIASFYKVNCGGGVTVITATFNATRNFVAIFVAEITGVSTGAIDTSTSNNQQTPTTSTDAVTTGNMTPGTQPAIVVGFGMDIIGNSTPATGTGFTSADSDATTTTRIEFQRITSTSAIPATFTAGTNESHSTIGLIFDEPSSGATGTGSAAESSFAVSGSGAETFTGTGSAAEAPFAASATGTESFTGTGSAAASPFAVSGASSQSFTGTGSAAASPFAAAGAGAAGAAGTGSSAASPFAASATGAELMTGTGSAAAAPFAVTASGASGATGTGSAAASHFAVSGSGTVGAGTAFPIVPSANGRYHVDDNGDPFPLLIDSAWGLVNQLDLSDAATYLDDRVSKGYTAIILQLMTLGSAPGPSNAPKDWANNQPFTTKSGGGAYIGTVGTADFAAPNDTYWTNVRAMVDLIASKGLLAICYVDFWGFGGSGVEGCATDITNAANTSGVCTAFGTYLATGNGTFAGFASCANAWFVDGGDYGINNGTDPSATLESRTLDIAAGMQAAGCDQLRYFDGQAPSNATDEPAFEDECQTQAVYTYGGVFTTTTSTTDELRTYQQARAGWNYTPVSASQGGPGASVAPDKLPTWEKETAYAHSTLTSPTATRGMVRKAELWAWLSGCNAGRAHGNEDIWKFASGTWETAITDDYEVDAGLANAFIAARRSHLFVPSELVWSGGTMRRLIPSSNGTQSGLPEDYVASSISSDGLELVAFTPKHSTGTKTFTVDLRSMAGTSRARWWDPTDGTFSTNGSADGTYSLANSASAQSFTTPGTNTGGDNDWILLIESLEPATGTGSAAEASFAASGTGAESMTGTGSAAASPFASAGTGAETFAGTGAGAAAPFGASATGAEAMAGTGSSAEAPFASSSAGTVVANSTGTGSSAAAPFGSTATGTVDNVISGTGSAALQPFGISGENDPDLLQVVMPDGTFLPLASFGLGLPLGTRMRDNDGAYYTLLDVDGIIDQDAYGPVSDYPGLRWVKDGVSGSPVAPEEVDSIESSGVTLLAIDVSACSEGDRIYVASIDDYVSVRIGANLTTVEAEVWNSATSGVQFERMHEPSARYLRQTEVWLTVDNSLGTAIIDNDGTEDSPISWREANRRRAGDSQGIGAVTAVIHVPAAGMLSPARAELEPAMLNNWWGADGNTGVVVLGTPTDTEAAGTVSAYQEAVPSTNTPRILTVTGLGTALGGAGTMGPFFLQNIAGTKSARIQEVTGPDTVRIGQPRTGDPVAYDRGVGTTFSVSEGVVVRDLPGVSLWPFTPGAFQYPAAGLCKLTNFSVDFNQGRLGSDSAYMINCLIGDVTFEGGGGVIVAGCGLYGTCGFINSRVSLYGIDLNEATNGAAGQLNLLQGMFDSDNASELDINHATLQLRGARSNEGHTFGQVGLWNGSVADQFAMVRMDAMAFWFQDNFYGTAATNNCVLLWQTTGALFWINNRGTFYATTSARQLKVETQYGGALYDASEMSIHAIGGGGCIDAAAPNL